MKVLVSLEEARELRGYRRLYAIATLLVLCNFLLWTYFSLDLASNAVPTVAVAAWALFALGYYALVPEQYFSRRMLFYGNVVDVVFATVLIWFSGRETSPFFFVYLLWIMASALSLGLRPSFALAGCATALYLIVGTATLSMLPLSPDQLYRAALGLRPGVITVEPPAQAAEALLQWSGGFAAVLLASLSQLWANLAALWLTAYVAGYFAQEIRQVRDSVQEARDKAEQFSRIDWLTGLHNRRHLDYLLAQEVNRAERYQRPLSLLLIDSDNLKGVNDTYGHPAGDQLLVTLAGLLRGEARLSDAIVRYGGDEFVVLLPDTDQNGARFLAERLRTAIEGAGFTWQGRRVPITVTVGVASFPQDAADAAELMARADAAMYAGKRAGRNRVVAARDVALPAQELLPAEPRPAPAVGAEHPAG
jgi:diguanylate cyclase (GGDEF)-like protein